VRNVPQLKADFGNQYFPSLKNKSQPFQSIF
jgi:hypothetical protein